ncbi:PAS domain-containing sensor histidine kinase [Chelatococcus sambhunathii]|uniref:histidine kinase n=1 Tax=Chelatococcus sambhunathii TaxID=363953 RepID=A0ABU1DH89_9HYPH|nr:PAS domain-containing sensor histidine kinase [Chelatococcus sambhunathii]MDR4307488.1 PAS domain-containing sensor histidine kinase [Chelatococcus sambhunathii]
MLQIAGIKALAEHVAQRVHPLAADDATLALRHRDTILTHLAVGAVPFAGLPALLALGHPLTGLGVAAFAWATAPIVTALGLSRSGALDRALIGFAIAFCAMAAGAAALTGGLGSPALALLLLPTIEAALGGSRLALRSAAAAAAAGLVGVALLAPAGAPAIAFEPAFAIVCGAASAVYALALAARAAALDAALERAGQPSDDRFELFAGSVGDLVTRHAANGAVVFASPAARDLLGLSPRELLDDGLFQRVHIADRPALLQALAAAADGEGTVTAEIRLKREASAGGGAPAFLWVEAQARRVRAHEADSASAARHPVIAMFRDVGARKAYEEELVAARQEAERASLAKTRFLAHMSHELRTPLNAIIGFSEALSDDALMRPTPERRAEYAALIRGSGEHLLEIVSSILDAARIESGAFAVTRRTCALAPIVDTCVNLVALKAQADGVTVSVEAAADTPDVDADPRAMTQIALNLLANAVKFTPRGGRVTVSLGRSRGGVALSVRDTGCGIAPEHIARLGEAFFRAGDGAVREGTGLGLSVVRGLVALHGGELDVQSALGQGTTVTVFLPPAEAAPPIPIGRASADDATNERAKRRA